MSRLIFILTTPNFTFPCNTIMNLLFNRC